MRQMLCVWVTNLWPVFPTLTFFHKLKWCAHQYPPDHLMFTEMLSFRHNFCYWVQKKFSFRQLLQLPVQPETTFHQNDVISVCVFVTSGHLKQHGAAVFHFFYATSTWEFLRCLQHNNLRQPPLKPSMLKYDIKKKERIWQVGGATHY